MYKYPLIVMDWEFGLDFQPSAMFVYHAQHDSVDLTEDFTKTCLFHGAQAPQNSL